MTTISSATARVAGVPGLLRYRGSAQQAAGRGTVVFYHGFGGSKERRGFYLTGLAEAGFLAVGLDAVGHAALEPWYAPEPDRIQYVEYPGAGHFLTPELDDESCRRMVAWFERWL